jgi:hypothetical protein
VAAQEASAPARTGPQPSGRTPRLDRRTKAAPRRSVLLSVMGQLGSVVGTTQPRFNRPSATQSETLVR